MRKKLSAKKYAELLIALTANKSKIEAGKIIRNFALWLKKNSILPLADRIIEEYERIYLAERDRAKLEISSAFKLGAKNKKELEALAKNSFGQDKFEIKEIINEKLGGGAVLKCNNLVLDLSLESLLNKLERSLKS